MTGVSRTGGFSKTGGRRREFAIFFLILGIYLLTLAWMFRLTHTGASSVLALVPVSFLAWRHGPLRGILLALLIWILTGFLFWWLTPPGVRIAPNGPEPLIGLASWILAAAAVGSISKLTRRLHEELEERGRLEAELRRYQDHLEEEIQARTRELERTQQQLLQAGKLQLAGQLAGGLAHDFGNHLTVILGHAEVLTEKLGDRELHRHIQQIQDAGYEASELTRNLLSLTRPGRVRSENIDVHALLQSVAEMAGPTLKHRIPLDLHLEALRHHVIGDPGQLKNAILNLLINAKDAMPIAGSIEIATREEHLEPPETSALNVKPGHYLRTDMKDTGPGIPPEHLGKIFEPFFSTKPEGSGTGLGLAAVKSMALSHGGAVSVASQLGTGSTFTIWLPVVDAPVTAGALPETPLCRLPAGTRVLLVDDEELVGEVIEELLQLAGATVIRYKDPARGLAWFRKNPGHCDVAIVDLQMPGMDGLETLAALHAVDPVLPGILLTAGQLDSAQMSLAGTHTCSVLQKPCSLNELQIAVERALTHR